MKHGAQRYMMTYIRHLPVEGVQPRVQEAERGTAESQQFGVEQRDDTGGDGGSRRRATDHDQSTVEYGRDVLADRGDVREPSPRI